MKLRKLILISGLLLGFAQTIGAQNQLITYPAPQEAELKDDFTVKVRQPGGKWQTIATYPVKVDEVKEARHHVKLASMSYFDFDGEVEVSVTAHKEEIETARIRPLSYGITPQVSRNTLTFKLNSPHNLSIEVNGDIFHNLHLFANPIDRNNPLKPGMKVQISREKGRKEFNHKLMKIVYEDAYIIVIEKMQGLLSVNTDRQKERTAYTILNEYVQRSGKQHRVHIVHRLDRDTSGLMMFAKDEKTQRTLRDNWHDIVTDRRYVAVVVGEMEKDAGTVVSWLTDRKLYVYSSPTDDGGQESITHYRTIKRANGYSLVELNLETGRKNQIRVHMQDLGHPIIGDGRYGLEDVNPIGRLALHAFKLCFYHPVTGELMRFETPYPGEFKKLVLKNK